MCRGGVSEWLGDKLDNGVREGELSGMGRGGLDVRVKVGLGLD